MHVPGHGFYHRLRWRIDMSTVVEHWRYIFRLCTMFCPAAIRKHWVWICHICICTSGTCVMLFENKQVALSRFLCKCALFFYVQISNAVL